MHGEQMIGPESRRDGEQGSHAADHQPGPGQQNQRERDFRNHQNIAQTPGNSAAASAAALCQRFIDVLPRRLNGRRQTENQPGEQRRCRA